jgi:GNAT superfamily N-acetyltransferase
MTNQKFNLSYQPVDTESVKPLVKLYREVFSTPPWNEAWVCSNERCGRNYGGAEACQDDLCKKCGAPLREYYPPDRLGQEIIEISGRTGFRIATLLNEGDLSGFWYGWRGTLEEINRQKLTLAPQELTAMEERLARADRRRSWLYLAEFGIKPELRGRGYGKELFNYGMRSATAENIIARTTPSSPAYYINRQNRIDTVWNYTDGSGRVIMARPYIIGEDDFPGCR